MKVKENLGSQGAVFIVGATLTAAVMMPWVGPIPFFIGLLATWAATSAAEEISKRKF